MEEAGEDPAKFSLILAKASSNLVREIWSISLIVSCVFSMDSIRSLRWVSRKPWRSAVSLYSSRAIMLTGPICSMRWRRVRQVSSSAARASSSRCAMVCIGAQRGGLDVDFSEAAGLKMFQIRAQLGHFAWSARRGLRAIGRARRGRFSIVSQWRPAAGAAPAPGRRGSAPGRGLRRGRRPVPARAGPARRSRGCAVRAPPRRRSAAAQWTDAALEIGMQAVNALEGGLRAAAALFQAGQLGGDLRGFLLQAFALLAQKGQLGLHLVEAGLGVACSASRRRVSSRFCSMTAAWLRARPCCGRPGRPTPAGAARRAGPRLPSASMPRPDRRCRARRCGALRCALPAARPSLQWRG